MVEQINFKKLGDMTNNQTNHDPRVTIILVNNMVHAGLAIPRNLLFFANE